MAGCETCSARELVKCGSGAFPGGVCIGLPLIFSGTEGAGGSLPFKAVRRITEQLEPAAEARQLEGAH